MTARELLLCEWSRETEETEHSSDVLNGVHVRTRLCCAREYIREHSKWMQCTIFMS